MHKRAGYGYPLLLTARKLVGILLDLSFQTDRVQRLLNMPANDSGGLPQHAHGEGDVFVNGHLRQQLEVLKNQTDFAPVMRKPAALHSPQLDAFHEDLPASGSFLANQKPDHRRLTRAGGSDQEQEVAFGHRQLDVLERFGAVRIALPDVLKTDDGSSCEVWC